MRQRAAVGAIAGGIHETHDAARDAAVRREQASLLRSFQEVATSLNVNDAMHAALRSAMAQGGSRAGETLAGTGETYALATNGAAPARAFTLETEIRNIRFAESTSDSGPAEYSLEVFLQYRLLREGSGKPLYVNHGYARHGPMSVERWAERNAGRFLKALEQSYRQLAETVVDDLFLVVRSRDSGISATEYAAGYFLDPVYPPRIRRSFPVAHRQKRTTLCGR